MGSDSPAPQQGLALHAGRHGDLQGAPFPTEDSHLLGQRVAAVLGAILLMDHQQPPRGELPRRGWALRPCGVGTEPSRPISAVFWGGFRRDLGPVGSGVGVRCGGNVCPMQ